ncbi:hypothetical protein NQ318_020702 [Aromia moschata]|uniref:Uncharacterized protein n=1 Tax=Aromia moschata TaxID=1265417 RepID=A0AAV8XDS5_9CUCU|nr:hypothetical protein NQ318_020702 [Aromia moschata]
MYSQILHESFNMRKVYVKMAPKLLTPEQKESRMNICADILNNTDTDPGFVEAVKTKATEVLNQLTEADFQHRFQQRKTRMERCRDRQGEYIEGEKVATVIVINGCILNLSPCRIPSVNTISILFGSSVTNPLDARSLSPRPLVSDRGTGIDTRNTKKRDDHRASVQYEKANAYCYCLPLHNYEKEWANPIDMMCGV